MGVIIDAVKFKLRYHLELKRKTTVIVGESGQGRTTFINLLDSSNSTVEIINSDGEDVIIDIINERQFNNRVKTALKSIARDNPEVLELSRMKRSKAQRQKYYKMFMIIGVHILLMRLRKLSLWMM